MLVLSVLKGVFRGTRGGLLKPSLCGYRGILVCADPVMVCANLVCADIEVVCADPVMVRANPVCADIEIVCADPVMVCANPVCADIEVVRIRLWFVLA